jgi:hypothetical protein
VKYIKWNCDYNRALSREEVSIRARLDRAPVDEAPKASFPWPPRRETGGVAAPPEGCHIEVAAPAAHETLLSQEEA